MNSEFQTFVDTAATERISRIERLLVGAVEIHLGRVPTDAEGRRHGKRVIGTHPPGHEHYFWDGWLLLAIDNHPNGLGFDATTFKELCPQ